MGAPSISLRANGLLFVIAAEAAIQDGSTGAVGIAVGCRVAGVGFLGSGLRRNDGGGTCRRRGFPGLRRRPQ